MNSKTFNKAMGAVIRRERKLKGLTQQQIGDALDVSYQQIQKFEMGNNCLSAHQLTLIAPKLGLTVADLFQKAGAKPSAAPTETDAACFMAVRYLRMLPLSMQERMVAGIRAMAYAKVVV